MQVGDRPFYLVEGMDDEPAQGQKLQSCENGPFYKTDFSIGHRGAPLQFPEHTKESYEAGRAQGRGHRRVRRDFHQAMASSCAATPSAICTPPPTSSTRRSTANAPCRGPARAPSPKCCASDLTLAQFKTLKGKMDASNPAATTAEGYLGGTASWRTDLYTGRGTLLTLRESIELNKKLGVKHTPELKAGDPQRLKAVFGSQASYAQKMIDEFKAAGVQPERRVAAVVQQVRDVLYWIKNEPRFGRQAVYLDDIDPTATRRCRACRSPS